MPPDLLHRLSSSKNTRWRKSVRSKENLSQEARLSLNLTSKIHKKTYRNSLTAGFLLLLSRSLGMWILWFDYTQGDSNIFLSELFLQSGPKGSPGIGAKEFNISDISLSSLMLSITGAT